MRLVPSLKARFIALSLLAVLALGPIGCGEVVSHAPEIGAALGLGIGGAVLLESAQDARAAGYRADQEAIRLQTMQPGFSK